MCCKRKGFDYCLGLWFVMFWYVSVLLGEFVFVSCKWILFVFLLEYLVFYFVVFVLLEMVWLFFGIFMIIGVFIFVV